MRFCVIVALAFLVAPCPLVGQATVRGTIRGTVMDPTGAALPEVRVTILNSQTGATRTGTTDQLGVYAFPLVAVGTYEIQAQKSGFKTKLVSGIRVETHATAVVDLTLELGELAQQVTVTAREEVLETTSSAVEGVIERERVDELPLNVRSFEILVRLEPGAVSNEIVTAQSGPSVGGGAFANGMRLFFNNFTVDGVDFNDPLFPGTTTGGGSDSKLIPLSNEAIQEFRVITQNSGADFGVNMGAQVAVTTRSGGSEVHGTIFEFLRNEKVDARNFFDGDDILPFKQNQFGVSVGGPVPFTRRSFIFGNYEGFRQRKKETRVVTVPTPALLAAVPGGTTNGFLQEVMEALFPDAPAGTFAPGDPVASFSTFAPKDIDNDVLLLRVDHNFVRPHSFTARYLFSENDGALGSVVSTGIPSVDAGQFQRAQNFMLQHAYTGRWVNEFRFGYTRQNIFFPARPAPDELVALGFSPDVGDPTGVPFMFFVGTGLNFAGQISLLPQGRIINTFQFNDVVSVVKGRHALRFGVDIIRIRANDFFDRDIRPTTVFVGFGPPFDTSPFGPTTGTFFAQTQSFFINPSNRGWRQTLYAAYFSDTLNASPDLTLNYGLRYEFNTPIAEVQDKLNNLYQVDSGGNPLADESITDISQTALFRIDGLDFTKVDKNNWGPRFGLAWKMLGSQKTILRAGYGIMYGRLFINSYTEARLNPPFVIPTVLVGQPFGTRASPAAGLPSSVKAVDPGFSTSYGQFYNINIQRELDADTVLQIAYVGSRAVHLDRLSAPNFGDGFLGVRPNPSFATINFIDDAASSSYNSLQLKAERRLAKGLGFQVSYTWSKSIDTASGTSQNVGSPLGIVTNFPMDQFNLRSNRGPSDFDIRHSVVINYIYQLPFGPRRALGNGATGIAGKLLEGWAISGIINMRSGQHFNIFTGTDTNGDGVLSDRATIVGDVSALRSAGDDPTVWFNASLVGTMARDDLTGTSGRNIASGPSLQNIDVAVHKNTSIGERYRIEFRTQFFNVLNHTNFSLPDNNISSPIFGRILSTSTPSRQIQFALKFHF